MANHGTFVFRVKVTQTIDSVISHPENIPVWLVYTIDETRKTTVTATTNSEGQATLIFGDNEYFIVKEGTTVPDIVPFQVGGTFINPETGKNVDEYSESIPVIVNKDFDDGVDVEYNYFTPQPIISTTLEVSVTNQNGARIGGVNISAYENQEMTGTARYTGVTNLLGIVSLDLIDKDALLYVKAEKDGYTAGTASITIVKKTTNSVTIIITEAPQTIYHYPSAFNAQYYGTTINEENINGKIQVRFGSIDNPLNNFFLEPNPDDGCWESNRTTSPEDVLYILRSLNVIKNPNYTVIPLQTINGKLDSVSEPGTIELQRVLNPQPVVSQSDIDDVEIVNYGKIRIPLNTLKNSINWKFLYESGNIIDGLYNIVVTVEEDNILKITADIRSEAPEE